MAKTSISLVSVQKPTANASPVLKRRNRFTSGIELQIEKIGTFRNGGRVSREKFWIEGGSMFFALMYGKQPLKLDKGMSTLKATTWDDLVAQLDEIKTITIAGGLDEALAAAANATRLNFSAAKDKKSAKA